jgi:trk system potassium uptake protein TrkA
MNIIIAGAGKVGFNLARTLSVGHNVTIIDKNSEALHRIQESLDILPINGDVEDSNIYKNFIDKKIDLFIAVTDLDNVNLISVLMADSVLEIERKFVRVQKHFYADTQVQDKLNIDKMIFPVKIASQTIVSLLDYPKANNVKFFKYTDYRLISVRVSLDINLSSIDSDNFKVVGIEREKSFFIPKKDEDIYKNDLVYFFGLESDLRDVCQSLEHISKKEIQKCVVFGADQLGVSIAKELIESSREVKLIDTNLSLCEKADEILEGKASVINLKYGDTTIFEDEGLSEADVFISATNNDEYNIIKSLEAQEKGIAKVMAINNEMEYYSLMHSLGIIVARGPKMSAYNTIMEHISSSGVIIEKSFCGSKAVVYMRKIFPFSSLIEKEIKPIKAQESKLFYIRDDKLFDFSEKIILQEDDLIVIFSTLKESSKVKQWIYEL